MQLTDALVRILIRFLTVLWKEDIISLIESISSRWPMAMVMYSYPSVAYPYRYSLSIEYGKNPLVVSVFDSRAAWRKRWGCITMGTSRSKAGRSSIMALRPTLVTKVLCWSGDLRHHSPYRINSRLPLLWLLKLEAQGLGKDISLCWHAKRNYDLHTSTSQLCQLCQEARLCLYAQWRASAQQWLAIAVLACIWASTTKEPTSCLYNNSYACSGTRCWRDSGYSERTACYTPHIGSGLFCLNWLEQSRRVRRSIETEHLVAQWKYWWQTVRTNDSLALLISPVELLLCWHGFQQAPPQFLANSTENGQKPQEINIACPKRAGDDAPMEGEKQTLQAIKFAAKNMPFLDLAIDDDFWQAGCFEELMHGYVEGLVEPCVMRGLQPVRSPR